MRFEYVMEGPNFFNSSQNQFYVSLFFDKVA
jgi:hypothetical protein